MQGSRKAKFGRRKEKRNDVRIATEANILFLKEEGYAYLCVSRSNIKKLQFGCQQHPCANSR